MNEEKQTGSEIVLAGNPYREVGIVSAGRKLSKEEAKSLIEIVRDESYITDGKIEGFTFETGFRNGFSFGILSALNQLGYTDKGSEIYTKVNDTLFYWVKETGYGRIPIISGNHYGNITELIDNFKRFDEFCDYAHEKMGFLEAVSIFPLLGLPILARSRILHQLAMDLPKDFANYKYGKDALEQLRKEIVDSEQKTPDKRLVAQTLQDEIDSVCAKHSQSIPSAAEKAARLAKYFGVEKEVRSISSMFHYATDAEIDSVVDSIEASEKMQESYPIYTTYAKLLRDDIQKLSLDEDLIIPSSIIPYLKK